MVDSLLEKLKTKEFTTRVIHKLKSHEFIARIIDYLRSHEFPARVAERLKAYGFTAPVEEAYTPSAQAEAFTRKLSQYAEQSNLVLFEGQWLTAEEARRRFRRLQWESTLKFVEMVILFLVMFFVVLMPFTFLALLGGIAA